MVRPVHHLYCPKKCILESYNEAFKDSTRSGYAGGGLLRLLAQWPMILYLPSWMTLPLPKNRSKVWLTQVTGAVRQHQNSSMTADSTLTWYGNTTAWSLWGNASNTSSNDERSSEKYAVGGRSRYNLTDMNYVFGQAAG
jgi:hypothetical protein